MQFLSENRLNRCQIFGRHGYFNTESEPIFGFVQQQLQHLANTTISHIQTDSRDNSKQFKQPYIYAQLTKIKPELQQRGCLIIH